MATSRLNFLPETAGFPTTSPATFSRLDGRPVILFDASADEYAFWTFVAWQGYSAALTALVLYRCANATSGTAAWQGALEAASDGDAVNADSFATQTAGTGTVPGTTTLLDTISISLTNTDSMAVGDLCRLRINRDVSADSVANDLALLAVEIREA